MAPPLAHAYLALADDDALVEQRTRPRMLVAFAAAVALALGAPLAFAASHPSDHKVVAVSSKSSLGLDDE